MDYLTTYLGKHAGYRLKPHQRRVVELLANQDSVLVYHGLGSGKTLTALAAGKELGMPVTTVGPAAIKHNFGEERKKHGIRVPLDSYSYNKPPEDDVPGLLVFDEAHRMGRSESDRSKLAERLSGEKNLLLTGTPIRNSPEELVPLMKALGIKDPDSPAEFKAKFLEEYKVWPSLWDRLVHGVQPGIATKPKDLDRLEKLLRGRVDYHASDTDDFPQVEEKEIKVEMTREQQKAHDMAMENYPTLKYKISSGVAPSKSEIMQLNAFLSASRQISNTPGDFNPEAGEEDSPKINRAFEEIRKRAESPSYRGVTYSTYLTHGIVPMANKLEQAGIPYAMFTGETAPEDRAEIVRDYNEGRLKHLLISGAGGEGLDLKGTKLVQLLEPHWNEPQMEQVIGRAVRYKSHDHLPPKDRRVEVQRFTSIPRPEGWIFKTRKKGTDEYLKSLADRKRKLNQAFLDTLKAAGTPG